MYMPYDAKDKNIVTVDAGYNVMAIAGIPNTGQYECQKRYHACHVKSVHVDISNV